MFPSETVNLNAEVRCFVSDGRVLDAAIDEGVADIGDAIRFVIQLIKAVSISYSRSSGRELSHWTSKAPERRIFLKAPMHSQKRIPYNRMPTRLALGFSCSFTPAFKRYGFTC